MNTFRELALRAELVDAAAAAGFDAPAPIQLAAIPVLRRGSNTVLLASSGSGVTAAYALALLDRLSQPAPAAAAPRLAADLAAAGPASPAMEPRALVITATEDRAAQVARTFVTLAGPTGIPVRALTVAWSAHGNGGVLVAPLAAAARALRDSSLKLLELQAVVFDGLPVLLALGDSGAFDSLIAALPHDAQRIVTAPEWSKDVERFVESNVRRAFTIPARPADPELVPPPARAGSVSYLVVPPGEKVAALARVLRRPRAEPPLVTVRSAARVRQLTDELAGRGFRVSASAAPDADAVIAVTGAGNDVVRIAADVPFDAAALSRLDMPDGLVLAEARELPHLQRIAAQAGIELVALAARPARGSVAGYREQVRKAVREQDLDAQLALLDPLFDEFSAAEIAAALSALLRARTESSLTAADTAMPAEQAAERPPAFVRLFMGIGTRDNVRPGELVGAITGEASISGDQVGKIDIRDTFSVVEVASDVADRVIRALNGTTMRGRSLRVDYDRRSTTPTRARGPRARA
jgi:ATP-dependent RNA helicase DeaD